MVTARSGHTATLLPDGKVLVAGGVGSFSGGTSLASAELYDPTSGTWTATGSMGTPRSLHTATQLRDGRVLVAGGYSGAVSGSLYGGGRLASAELYDPARRTWTATGSMVAHAGGGLTATLLPDGQVLVAGSGSEVLGAASAELYNPDTGSWTATGTMIQQRSGQTATLLADGRVLVAGGYLGGDGNIPLASAELYDPGTRSWTAAGSLPGRGNAAVRLADGMVLVIGSSFGSGAAFAALYDPRSGTWTPTGSIEIDPGAVTATLLANGKVLVAGGSAELYDPRTATWIAASTSTPPYEDSDTATLLANGDVLLAGGYSDPLHGVPRVAAELYDPGSPAPSSSVGQPTPGMVAFISSPVGGGYAGQLWVANADGTGARQLVPDPAGSQGAPSWSPDGTRLVFSRNPLGGMGGGYPTVADRLYLTDASGTKPRLVDTGCVAPCRGDTDASFSPDGTRLVFVRQTALPPRSVANPNGTGPGTYAPNTSVLATIDLATGRVTELASTIIPEGQFPSGDPRNHHPRWSPDGTQIVFTQDVPDPAGMLSAVFIVDADGTNLHRIGLTAQTADWSPDGTRIVVGSVSYVGSVPPDLSSTFRQYFDIYTVRPDGTGLRRLTTDRISAAPSWTADGRIGFLRYPALVNGTFDDRTAVEPQFWIMDVDGTNATQLIVSKQLQDAWPIVWQPQS